jgi:hypothetical protein
LVDGDNIGIGAIEVLRPAYSIGTRLRERRSSDEAMALYRWWRGPGNFDSRRVGLYFLLSSLDSIVKAAVENYGSEMTQARVQVDDVEIELTSGKGALRGMTVGNPPGFKSERALGLAQIGLQLDVGSVAKDTVLIKEITITAPEVSYEFALKGSNLEALKQNVDAYSAQGRDKSKAAEKTDEEGKKLIVEHLYIRDGKVNVSATDLQVKLPARPCRISI